LEFDKRLGGLNINTKVVNLFEICKKKRNGVGGWRENGEMIGKQMKCAKVLADAEALAHYHIIGL